MRYAAAFPAALRHDQHVLQLAQLADSGPRLAAAFWRGRRFGPLVVEDLPVTVRASETMEGRARLYAKGSARLRAVDSLRIGAVQRVARACGLPATATVDAVVLAAADLTGRPPSEVHAILVGEIPRTDAEMVRLSDALLTLERAATEAVRSR